MTVAHDNHRERVDAAIGFEWDLLPSVVERSGDVPPSATEVRLRRTRSSHRGIAPLSDLTNLAALFLTNLRVADGSLEPLHSLERLRVLQCARFFARNEFRRLELALPSLRCEWFDDSLWP